MEKDDILYEDNHLIAVNKHSGDLVQPDPDGTGIALEQVIKNYIKFEKNKPSEVFLGVIHRIDRPVSGVVIFAKTSKALVRMNELIKNRQIKKTYLAIVENMPPKDEDRVISWISRDSKKNKSYITKDKTATSQEAILNYRYIAKSDKYYLIEIDLETGRHHQIRAQLASIGCSIKGDLKYGAKRSNQDGSISLISYKVEFMHPVKKESIEIRAKLPDDTLWQYFSKHLR